MTAPTGFAAGGFRVGLDVPRPWSGAALDADTAACMTADVDRLAELGRAFHSARVLGGRGVFVCPAEGRRPQIVAVLAIGEPPGGTLSDLVEHGRDRGLGAELGRLGNAPIAAFVRRQHDAGRGSFLHVSYLLPAAEALILLGCSAPAGPADRAVVRQCARLFGSVGIVGNFAG